MNRAFLRGLLSELEKNAEQPQMQMMPAIPPELLAALMGTPEPEYEEPSMLQMMLPSLGLGAAGLGVAAAGGLGWPHVAPHLSSLKSNLAAKAAPMMSRFNPMRLFRKGASEKLAMAFLKQKRPRKVKEIYSALKRDHPTMPAEMKARISARQGKPGKQAQGPPYSAPLAKTARRRQQDEREDPPGALGLVLRLMRRLGKGGDSTTVRAFQDLGTNIPSNKRPY